MVTTATASPPVVTTARFPLHCAHETSLGQLASSVRLGPFDQLTRWYLPLTVVFVYRHRLDGSGDETVSVARLRRALAHLLDSYPHLTGRLALDPTDQTLHIDRLGAGAALTTAHCAAPLQAFEGREDADDEKPSRLLMTRLPDGGNALLPSAAIDANSATDEPILAVQHTRFACGGVAVGFRVRHVICDADAFFQLIHNLAELYRVDGGGDDVDVNVALAKPPPSFRPLFSELHEMSEADRQRALAYSPQLFELAPLPPVATSPNADTNANTSETSVRPRVTGRVFRFSEVELARIKAAANASTTNTAGGPHSTFDAVAAHIWQSVYRARVHLCELQSKRHAASEAAATAGSVSRQFLASINMRAPLKLPPPYFGNCVLCPAHELPHATLLDAPLAAIAAFVHDAVRSVDADDTTHTLRWIAAQPNKQRVQLRRLYAEGDLILTTWNKFGMYTDAELDGPPALVASPFTPQSLVDGLVYLYATEDQLLEQPRAQATTRGVSTGSIDVALTLSEPLWAVLDEDKSLRCYRDEKVDVSAS